MRARRQGTLRKDGRWQIVVILTRFDGAKIRKTLYGATQKEVQDAAAKLIYETKRVAPDKTTMNQLLDFCEESVWPAHAEKTRIQYSGATKQIRERFGKLQVAAITVPMIYQWILDMNEAGVGGRTVQVRRNVLRVALQQAVFYGIVQTNVAAGWKAPIKAKPAPRIRLEVKDILAAIDVQPDRRRKAWIQTLWETGARPSEVSRLSSNCLRAEDKHRWIVIKGTKTDAGAGNNFEGRFLPISEDLYNQLMELPEPWFGFNCRQWTNIWHDTQVRLGLRPPRSEKKREKPEKPLATCYAIRGARIEYWRTVHKVTDEVWAYLAGHEDPDLTRTVYDRVALERIAEQLGMSS